MKKGPLLLTNKVYLELSTSRSGSGLYPT